MRTLRLKLGAMVLALLAVTLPMPSSATAADPVPPFIMPDASWLTVVNYYRAMAGLNPVTEDTTLSAGAYNHSCYMLWNGITHDETPGLKGYTTNGDLAGNNGNVAVSSGYGSSARNHIELWMTGPFHAIGILRAQLQTVGFGKCDLQETPTWHSGATLNVLTGLNYAIAKPSTPVLFPGNGTTTSLSKFITESPNPLSFCSGWTQGGLPVIALMPEKVTSVTASITGPNGTIPTCALYGGNTTGVAQAILGGDNAVTVIPNAQLQNGTYTVTVTTNARTVKWSFTVDSAAASGIMPVPTVAPIAGPSAYTAVTPFRLADSRVKLRVTKLLAGVPKKLTVAGQAGIPADATALSANFTVVNEASSGHLTVYNCTTSPPNASTLNYYTAEVTANAGLFPLNSKGELCLFSPRDTDIVIDITGYFRPSSLLRFEGLEAVPVFDTVKQLNSTGRMVRGQTAVIPVVGAGVGVPSGAVAVAVNITSVLPSSAGYLTAYACGSARPTVSNVNPQLGKTKQNFAIVPLSASGTMCLYTLNGTDAKVDVLGFFTNASPHAMVPSTPTRVTDTRDLYRTQMNLGTGGMPLSPTDTKTLVLAGQRGIPSNASVVSINVAAVTPTMSGSLTIWDCGTMPSIQSVNYSTGRTVATGIQVQLSNTGSLCIRSTTTTHVIIDVMGWWT